MKNANKPFDMDGKYLRYENFFLMKYISFTVFFEMNTAYF